MKKKILILFLLVPFFFSSQVIIGKGKTSITNSSVSLEFGTEPKGIVLPWVTSEGSVLDVVPGTLIFDTTDQLIKVKQAASWLALSPANSSGVDTTLQDAYPEKVNAKVSIGTPTNTSGILVLEDSDKGMILPLVASYEDVKSPAAGMMVFDTTLKFLCFYNGEVWSFWKG